MCLTPCIGSDNILAAIVDSTGHLPQSPTAQVSATISVSAPVSSVSTDSKSESPTKQTVLQVHPQETNRRGRKTNRGRRGKAATLSVHQSSHFKVLQIDYMLCACHSSLSHFPYYCRKI